MPRDVDTAAGFCSARAAVRDTVVTPGHRTDWGGYSGYFTDPDGFPWEIAHNPDFPHV